MPPVTTSTLPSSHHQQLDTGNKYFSVRGYKDFTNKVQEKYGPGSGLDSEHNQKYFSVDAKFLHQQAASDMKNRLRENLKVSNTSAHSSNSKPDLPQYYQPPPPPSYPPYQRPPPPLRQNSDLSRNSAGISKPLTKPTSNLESSRAMAGSVSWLEWTQQLQVMRR